MLLHSNDDTLFFDLKDSDFLIHISCENLSISCIQKVVLGRSINGREEISLQQVFFFCHNGHKYAKLSSFLLLIQVAGPLNAALCHLEAAPYLPDPVEITKDLLDVSVGMGIMPVSGEIASAKTATKD